MNIEEVILKALYESHSGLEVGTLYSRCKVEFGAFARSLEKLRNNGFIKDDNDFYTLTELGFSRVSLRSKRPRRKDKSIEYVEEPYVPNVNYLKLLAR